MEFKILTPAAAATKLATAIGARHTTVRVLHLIPVGGNISIGPAESQTIALADAVQYTFRGQIDLNSIYIFGNASDGLGVIWS